MINNKTKSTIAAVTILGLSFFASDASAQRSGRGYSNNYHSGSSCDRPVYRDILRNDVYALDRIADQMVRQFSMESCGCRNSVAFLNGLRSFNCSTRDLVRAYNGTCKVSFERAACATHDSMLRVAKLSTVVRDLSCSMKSSMTQTISLTKNIHRNAHTFQPAVGYTSVPRPSTGHGHHYSEPQDPFAALVNSLFRSVR